MDEVWDYLTEEQKQTVADAVFGGFIEAIKRYDFKTDIERACDGLVDHVLSESTPELLTDAVKEQLEKHFISSLINR